MTLAWVVGGRGLLGTALRGALARTGTMLFAPTQRLVWTDRGELAAQIGASVREFGARAASSERWEIYWAAGIGTMSTPEADLALETATLALLLGLAADEPALMAVEGGVALASSAGAIYAGTTQEVVTEASPVVPTTDYARSKILQEQMVSAFAQASPRVRVLNARLSTLYGAGQSPGKKQGLLSSIARAMLRNQPIQIFVPYDTIRDYLHVDDAAERIIAALRTAAVEELQMTTRIIASERPTTIAEIVSIFKRVAKRPPRIVTSTSAASRLYTKKVQFQSVVSAHGGKIVNKSLVVGIAQLLANERAALVYGGSPLHV